MDDYEKYLDRYCKVYGLTHEEAETHKLVQEVKMHYEKKKRKEE